MANSGSGEDAAPPKAEYEYGGGGKGGPAPGLKPGWLRLGRWKGEDGRVWRLDLHGIGVFKEAGGKGGGTHVKTARFFVAAQPL